MSLAEKQIDEAPLIISRRLMGFALTFTGDAPRALPHFDKAIALCDPTEHRPLGSRHWRSITLWILGYADTALADVEPALSDAREIEHTATVIFALVGAARLHLLRRDYDAAKPYLDELASLAGEKGALVLEVVRNDDARLSFTSSRRRRGTQITSGITDARSTGSTWSEPFFLSVVANAYADLGLLDDARRCIGEAVAASACRGASESALIKLSMLVLGTLTDLLRYPLSRRLPAASDHKCPRRPLTPLGGFAIQSPGRVRVQL